MMSMHMNNDKYKVPNDGIVVDVVAEAAPAVRSAMSVQEIRHNLMDAISMSSDIDKLNSCLVILNGKSKDVYKSKYRTKTDEELDRELAQFPSWDATNHPDLSSLDYRQYKHRKSQRMIKAMSKWLSQE